MSGILYKEYKEIRQRSVALLTVLPPKDWRWIASRFLEADGNSRSASDIDISRDDSSQITCYQMIVTLPMDNRNRNQVLTQIFGNDFLKIYLPITDKNKMGNTAGVFVRMGSMANPKGPPSNDEEFALFSILNKRGADMNNRHRDCFKEFDKSAIDPIGNGVIADLEAVRTQAKKYRIEGGNWLLYPQNRTKEHKPIKPKMKRNMCKRAFDKIVRDFLEGSLHECGVTRVMYPLAKEVIKVFNEKSEYFEESAKNPRPDVKQIYAADIEVNQTYLRLSLLDLDFMKLKYKPEIFTVWKLHANDAPGGVLTLYHDLPHSVKVEIAQNCRLSSPSPPVDSPSPDDTPIPVCVPTPSL